MPGLDARAEQHLREYGGEVAGVLGERCVGVVLYGSAAGVDFVAGRSDFNTVIVVRDAPAAVLDRLAPVIARWRTHGFALPVVLDEAQVERAAQLFPMELDDIRRQHRLLAGRDPFAALPPDEAALRRECAQEAFGKLLRLRAFYLEHREQPAALAGMMVESVKSFLIVVRHLLRLREQRAPAAYDEALSAGERIVGPLPAMRRVLAARPADAPRDLAGVAHEYVDEVERLVAAVTEYCA
ncbi:MAG: hypothetical protein SF182_05825 [Deltaproteobacteria bacterium]|nr:hypothetical protein [Deltaproteobacteria bacterium]